MIRNIDVGRLLFGLAFLVEGVFALAAHDFLLGQQQVPPGVPWREALACLSGAVMLLAGLGLLVAPLARLSARVLAAYFLMWVLALHLPHALTEPMNVGYWLQAGEVSTLAAGAWLIYLALDGRAGRTMRIAQAWFGIALMPIGLSHFAFFNGSHLVFFGGPYKMIPGYVPFRPFLTYFTGFAHIAAGFAIATGVVPRLAATLETVMESLFTLIVWGTLIFTATGALMSWVHFVSSISLSAAAWVLARSYGNATTRRAELDDGLTPAVDGPEARA